MSEGDYVLAHFEDDTFQAGVIVDTDPNDRVLVDNLRHPCHKVEWLPQREVRPVAKDTLNELGLLWE